LYVLLFFFFFFFFSSRRRHTRSKRDWSSDVCSSDLIFIISDLLSPLVISLALLVSGVTSSIYKDRLIAAAAQKISQMPNLITVRSEERRVGKECRCLWVMWN